MNGAWMRNRKSWRWRQLKRKIPPLYFSHFGSYFCHDAPFSPHFFWQPPVELLVFAFIDGVSNNSDSNGTSHQFTLEISSKLKRSWQTVDQWLTMVYYRTINEPAHSVFTSLSSEQGLIVACNILFTNQPNNQYFDCVMSLERRS